ncbi:aromatic ring-hydroxylating dioxygenase subunit alpha [Sphingomonas sp.]|uniref:aromatic ring-hydroxylating dioxygenase subunit alpha n=1 Tax=Sphingomonas sp. TaxID=28214 RepID=UPI0025F09413|nr:aromatic ring-hydroxylating dioxygenase subunit alpha [Sphingomonas sp.]
MAGTYLRNSWYVAAWSREIADKPFARTMLDEDIVLYRGADGAVAALEDRCPHRHLPLSMGSVTPAGLQCGYHGLVMGGDGRCVSVPSQQAAPPNARVKAYVVVERYGWVWVWMGAAENADPALIPDFGLLDSAEHAAVGKTNRVACDYRLVTDNLMDLSHVGYVHTSTIGNAAFGEKGKLTVQRTEHGVSATRLVPDVPPPPLYVKSGVLPEGKNLDRWSTMQYLAPSCVIIHTGGAEVGTGALEGKYKHGLNLWVMNAMTPETSTTTNYFWASVRAHALGDAAADTLFFEGVGAAFEEDRIVLEAQQRVLDKRGDSWAVAFRGDAAAVESRRVLDRRIAEEQTAAAVQAHAAE